MVVFFERLGCGIKEFLDARKAAFSGSLLASCEPLNRGFVALFLSQDK